MREITDQNKKKCPKISCLIFVFLCLELISSFARLSQVYQNIKLDFVKTKYIFYDFSKNYGPTRWSASTSPPGSRNRKSRSPVRLFRVLHENFYIMGQSRADETLRDILFTKKDILSYSGSRQRITVNSHPWELSGEVSIDPDSLTCGQTCARCGE